MSAHLLKNKQIYIHIYIYIHIHIVVDIQKIDRVCGRHGFRVFLAAACAVRKPGRTCELCGSGEASTQKETELRRRVRS